MSYEYFQSPIGELLLIESEGQLVRIGLPNQSDELTANLPPAPNPSDATRAAAQALEQYFSGEPLPRPSVRASSEFQKKVLEACSQIPYGEVRTYSQVAQSIDSPDAVRAVGTALGKNPLPIFVPCHRVVSSNGLGGYAGGLDSKQFLLALESQ